MSRDDVRDNVIAIETRFTEAPPVDWKPRDYLACQHKHTMLDEVLHTVGCRDCGEERLDPFEVLMRLARQWRDWKHEADQLNKLRIEYRNNERDKWERARDRHLNANPEHRGTLQVGRKSWQWYGGVTQPCRTCYRIELQYDARWYPTPAPEPPPGRLDAPQRSGSADPAPTSTPTPEPPVR